MNERPLVIVGDGAIAEYAAAIGIAERGASRVRVVALPPDRIADTPLAGLMPDGPESADAFAAIGVAALNFARFDLWAKLRLEGYACATLVDPRAVVDPSAVLGDNVLVGAGAIIEAGVQVGTGTVVESGGQLCAHARIGAWCWVGGRAFAGPGAVAGAHCVLGHGVSLASGCVVSGPGEIDVPGTYTSSIPGGTFVSTLFKDRPVRVIPRGGSGH